ncbi:uncharacterized protein LOC130992824 [Salvia miltiorrhiza]|uniref:uncharacterized protein LOC130992824 n=1 Tax=Salvia miltiorrhiza TaxID=226208 RepID=UPI0025ACEE2C|nr:uncharacterized protein LOC130992824 [Salvia miltiorrhiza]
MVATTRSTEQRLDGLEKAVEELITAVDGFRTYQVSTDSKLDALLKKFNISPTGTGDESEGSRDPESETETPTPLQVFQKMDLPNFDGTDALAWLARADQYFLVHETPRDKRLKTALIAMSGPAMAWVQLLLRRCPTLTWTRFSRELLNRFGHNAAINGYEALGATKQEGSLEDYIAAFEGRAAQLPDFTDEQYLGFFLSGLKPHIRKQIQDPTVTDYSAAVLMARKVEQEPPPVTTANYSTRPVFIRHSSPVRPQSAPPATNTSSVVSHTSSASPAASLTSSAPPRNFRNISNEEYMKHRAAGTCFRCGLKYGPLHRCPPKTLQVLIGDMEDDPGRDLENYEDTGLKEEVPWDHVNQQPP